MRCGCSGARVCRGTGPLLRRTSSCCAWLLPWLRQRPGASAPEGLQHPYGALKACWRPLEWGAIRQQSFLHQAAAFVWAEVGLQGTGEGLKHLCRGSEESRITSSCCAELL
jgi:hypothetical protein